MSTILTIGAVAVGGYLAYKYLKDPLGQVFGGLAGGLGDIAGGAGDVFGDIGGGISDFFGGIAGALGLDGGNGGNGDEIYVGGERAATGYVPIMEQREIWREELPGLDPLIEKAEQSGIEVPAYIQRQMARGMAQEELIQTSGYREAMAAKAAAGY